MKNIEQKFGQYCGIYGFIYDIILRMPLQRRKISEADKLKNRVYKARSIFKAG